MWKTLGMIFDVFTGMVQIETIEASTRLGKEYEWRCHKEFLAVFCSGF